MQDLNRYFIGLDNLFSDIHKYGKTTYPPYNIIKVDDDQFRIEIAAAGFDIKELDVVLEDSRLVVTGNKSKTENTSYIYKGLSDKHFERKFVLNDDVKVEDVVYNNGIIQINLKRYVPEEKQPKKIPITQTKNTLLLEQEV